MKVINKPKPEIFDVPFRMQGIMCKTRCPTNSSKRVWIHPLNCRECPFFKDDPSRDCQDGSFTLRCSNPEVYDVLNK